MSDYTWDEEFTGADPDSFEKGSAAGRIDYHTWIATKATTFYFLSNPMDPARPKGSWVQFDAIDCGQGLLGFPEAMPNGCRLVPVLAPKIQVLENGRKTRSYRDDPLVPMARPTKFNTNDEGRVRPKSYVIADVLVRLYEVQDDGTETESLRHTILEMSASNYRKIITRLQEWEDEGNGFEVGQGITIHKSKDGRNLVIRRLSSTPVLKPDDLPETRNLHEHVEAVRAEVDAFIADANKPAHLQTEARTEPELTGLELFAPVDVGEHVRSLGTPMLKALLDRAEIAYAPNTRRAALLQLADEHADDLSLFITN